MPGFFGKVLRGESVISFLKVIRAGTRASQFATQLRDRFSRQTKSKACVDWQAYYRLYLEDVPGHALIGHRGPFVGDDASQTQIIDAMAAGKRAFLVSAPPGCGKSRFALELARRIGRVQRTWDVRFVRHDPSGLREELGELSRSRNLVLIVDDAQDCPSLVQLLAAACAAAESSRLHLVCLTQPAGRVVLAEALAGHFAGEATFELDLGRPSANLLRELIDKLIPQLSPHHRDVIRRLVADSFFAPVLLCSSAARQKNLPQTLSARNLREFAVRQPVAQAVGDLCTAEKALRALAVYAACAPVRTGDAAVRESAAVHSGLSIADIEVLERRVVESGLFEVYGREWLRPVPDLVGDLILEDTCLDEQGRPTALSQALIRGLFEPHHGAIIRNCVDIERLFAAGPHADLLSDLVLERAGGLSAETRSDAFELLVSCAPLARRQPGTIVRLLEAMAGKGVFRGNPPARELGHVDSLEVRAQLVLTSASEQDPTIVRGAMAYSRGLLACARSDSRSYQFLRDNLLTSCQFAVGRPLAHTSAVLDVLNTWLGSSDVETAALAASMVRGFLRLEMRSHRWDEGNPTPTWVSLTSGESIWTLRDRAIDLLVRAARHAAPEVQFAAADCLGHWAHGYGNLSDAQRQQWAGQLDRELDVLAESFAELSTATSHFPVRAAVERQGWSWWTGDIQAFERGGKRILEAFPQAPPYSLWKALHEDRLPVLPLPLDAAAGPAQRRDSLQAVIEPDTERKSELARELFDQLSPTCQAPASWATLFTSVLSALPRQPLQRRAPLYVAEFVKRQPLDAWSFVTEAAATGPLRTILPPLLGALRGQDSARWREEVQRASPGTRLFEVELRALCEVGELDPAELSLVSKGLELEDAAVVHLAAQALLNTDPAALGARLPAVFAVLPARAADERLWELTLDAFVRWGRYALAQADGEEAGPQMRAISGELMKRLRVYGHCVSWAQGPHAQPLAGVLSIFAATMPHTLKSWMREVWSQSVDPAMRAELPLSSARWSEVVRLIAGSATAGYWQKQFVEWIVEEPDLGAAGAQGLAQLCELTHPCVPGLVARVVREPSNASLEALGEFMRGHGDSPQFLDDALSLLAHFADSPEAYDLLEKEVIFAMTRAAAAPVQATGGRGSDAALKAIERRARDAELAAPLRATLERARQAIQSAAEERLLNPDLSVHA